MLGKYKTKRLEIPGHNSNKYNQNNVSDVNSYKKINISNIEVVNDVTQVTTADNMVGDTVITTLNKDRLIDTLLVLSSRIKSKNEIQPFDVIDSPELAFVTAVEITNDDRIQLTLRNKLITNHLDVPSTLQFAFILYPTVTSTGNIVYDQGDNTWHLPVASSQNNITINTQFSNIEVGDYVILDWGKKRNLRKSNRIPYVIDANGDMPNQFTSRTYRDSRNRHKYT